MANRARELEVDQFIRALNTLRNQYSLATIAQRLCIDQANLSHYSSGRKKPGAATLGKFYRCFRKELEILNSGYAEYEPMDSHVSDAPRTKYRHSDPGGQQPDEITRLNGIIDDLVTANRRMAKSMEAIVQSNHQLVETIRDLVKNNVKIAGAVADESDLPG